MHIDNEAARYVMNKGSGRDPAMMVAQRELVLAQLRGGFRLCGKYVRSEDNVLGDSASRGEYDRFFEHGIALGVERADWQRVEPTLDVPRLIQRMQRARQNAERAAEQWDEGQHSELLRGTDVLGH